MKAALLALAASSLLSILSPLGCTAGRSEGLDAARLPPDIRPDYAVFALRCSKCHSLSRTLNSGIDDDSYWAMYVARMRRQPASGITSEDAVSVLRFLHYFSVDERERKGKPVPPYMRGPSEPDAARAP